MYNIYKVFTQNVVQKNFFHKLPLNYTFSHLLTGIILGNTHTNCQNI
ncbi:unnamed protein product [Tenebrio molitor]|nr:unnamed protein product [Tenebrio molitor]